MPGKMITEQQVRNYMQFKENGKTQAVAAAQAGFSERSAHNIETNGFTKAKPHHHWCTRKDPFEAVWTTKIIPLLEQSPRLEAKTVLEDLQKQYPEQYPDSTLRTLHPLHQKLNPNPRASHRPFGSKGTIM